MAGFLPPLSQRRVFFDSSAYLALLDEDDDHHREAEPILRRLAQFHYRPYTTNVLVMEAHALILSTLGIATAGLFLRDIDAGSTVVVRVRAADEQQAKEIIFRHTDKDYSFVDAVSFVIMERLQISQAFTFDHHFAQHGHTLLTV